MSVDQFIGLGDEVVKVAGWHSNGTCYCTGTYIRSTLQPMVEVAMWVLCMSMQDINGANGAYV
jgi:hypothetical protein